MNIYLKHESTVPPLIRERERETYFFYSSNMTVFSQTTGTKASNVIVLCDIL